MDTRRKSANWKQNCFNVIVCYASNQLLRSWSDFRHWCKINTNKHTKHTNIKIIVWGWVSQTFSKKKKMTVCTADRINQLVRCRPSSHSFVSAALWWSTWGVLKGGAQAFSDDFDGKIRLERRFQTYSYHLTCWCESFVPNHLWHIRSLDQSLFIKGDEVQFLQNYLKMQRNILTTKHTLRHLKAVLKFHVTFLTFNTTPQCCWDTNQTFVWLAESVRDLSMQI